ncbi:MAG: hypothetical protein ITG00_09395 [Flavobacterium sp.]|nr:hypothetical protein [Flavobacterium sp.]
MSNEKKPTTEETGIGKPHKPVSDIGAGRQIGDPRSGTLSDRAGDESFDDDTRIRPEEPNTSEEDDDL